MKSGNRLLLVGAAWLVLLLVAGCGKGGGRLAVSGTVTLKGEPLDQGSIEFLFTGDQKGAAGGALIRDGRYKIPRETGLAPGTYKVVIHSAAAPGDQGEQAPGPPARRKGPPPDRIPASFNTQSNILVEVKPDSDSTFDFPIP